MSSDITWEYLATIVLWIVVPGYLFLRSYHSKFPSVGLLLAYCLQLALIHLTGALIQVLPWYTSKTRAETVIGFPITAYALIGLIVGYFLAQPGVLRRSRPGAREEPIVLRSPDIGWICIAVGLAAYFGTPFFFNFASLSSVVSNGLSLAAIGFCYEWWFYYRSGYIQLAWQIAAGVFIIPVLTVMLLGFLGFGINAVVLLGAFVAVSGVPRRTILVGGVALGFSLLSIYAAYMGVRNQIRSAVWGGPHGAESTRCRRRKECTRLVGMVQLGQLQSARSNRRKAESKHAVGRRGQGIAGGSR